MKIWLRKWFRNNRLVGSVLFGFLTISLCAPRRVNAQQTLEDRYRSGIELFNAAKMEDACEQFQQIQKEQTGYKNIDSYLKPACDAANKTYVQEEKLFNQGVELFNKQQFDEAKQKFTYASNLQLKRPKYRAQMDEYLKQIAARSSEEAGYQQAAQLFNEGKDEESEKLFSQIEQKKGGRAEDAHSYLLRIRDRREDTTWYRAVEQFAKNDLPGARITFEQIARMKGRRAAEAEKYLGQITAVEIDRRTFDEAVKAFVEKRYPASSTGFQQLIQKGSAHAAEAQAYLLRINKAHKEDAAVRDTAKKAVETGQDPKRVAQQLVADARTEIAGKQYVTAVVKLKAAESLDPANQDAQFMLSHAEVLAEEQPLRQGLEAYFQGRYDEAERQLGDYVEGHGHKLGLAYFFRGAVHASRYFLSDQKDTRQKDLAFADFRALPKEQNFLLPKDFVSPKVLDLYAQAAKAPSQ